MILDQNRWMWEADFREVQSYGLYSVLLIPYINSMARENVLSEDAKKLQNICKKSYELSEWSEKRLLKFDEKIVYHWQSCQNHQNIGYSYWLCRNWKM